MRPSYKTNDPVGWCGDAKRGAAMGRRSLMGALPECSRLTLRHVRLNGGDYDSNGTYFGFGPRLYWCASDDGEIDFMLRAKDRDAAKASVRGDYPNARFYR